MKLDKYIHIRDSKTEKQQIIPLYSLKEDVGNKAVNLLLGEDIVYASLGTPGEVLSSKLIFRKRDKIYAAQKLDEADTIPLNRFYHIVKYDSKLHEAFLEKTDAFAKKMLEAKTSDELTKYDAERGRFQHLARITDFSSTLYRGDHEELPNPLDTSDLDDTAYMFYGCTKLKTIPELDLSHVMDMRSMFKNCKSLPEVFPWYIDATKMDEIEKYRDMFRGSSVKHACFKNPPDSVRDLIPLSAELMGLEGAAIADILLSQDKYKMKDLYPDTYQTATTFDGPFGVLGMDTIEEIYDGCEKLTDPVLFDTFGIRGFERMFQNCASLPENFPYAIGISGISGAADLADMFKGTPVKHARFSTANPSTAYDITGTILGNGAYSTIEVVVTNENHHMKEIFPGWYDKMMTSTLKTTDTSEFEIIPSSLTDTSLMFKDCSSLTQMDSQRILALNGITNMNSMFYNCSSLTETPALDTSSCEDMASMYRGCSSLISVEKMNTMAARDISNMFYGCKKLPKTISSYFDAEHITHKEGFEQMFGDTSVEEISFLDAEPSVRNQVTPSWFGNSVKKVNWLAALDWVVKDSTLRKLDLYDAVVIRDTEHSLCEIEGLESVNEIIFENIEDASRAIGDCKKLETIGKITGTGNVKNMANMFAGCKSLCNVPEIDTSSAQDMRQMFQGCISLPEDIFMVFDFKNIKSASALKDMFADSSVRVIRVRHASKDLRNEIELATLSRSLEDIIYIDDDGTETHYADTQLPIKVLTDNAYKMSDIYPADYEAMESAPNKFDVKSLTTAKQMFADCKSLKKAPSMNTSELTDMSEMYKDCTSLPESFPQEIDIAGISDAHKLLYMFEGSSVNSVVLKNAQASVREALYADTLGEGIDVYFAEADDTKTPVRKIEKPEIFAAHKTMVDNAKNIIGKLKAKFATFAANDTNTDADRATMQKEFDQSIDQIDENANQTYNGQYLVDGSKDHEIPLPGTRTSVTNESLSPDTTAETRLTALKDGDGNSLQIEKTDTITVSYVMDGKTYTGSTKVEKMRLEKIFEEVGVGDTDLAIRTPLDDTVGKNEFGEVVKNPSGRVGLTVQSQHYGVDGQIAGLTITFTDEQGAAKEKANDLFEHLITTVRAKDSHEDSSLKINIEGREYKMSFPSLLPRDLGFPRSKTKMKKLEEELSIIDFFYMLYPDWSTGTIETYDGFMPANYVGTPFIKFKKDDDTYKTFPEILLECNEKGFDKGALHFYNSKTKARDARFTIKSMEDEMNRVISTDGLLLVGQNEHYEKAIFSMLDNATKKCDMSLDDDDSQFKKIVKSIIEN